jgi:hypothetical protein
MLSGVRIRQEEGTIAFCFLLSAFCFLPSAFCLLLSAFPHATLANLYRRGHSTRK